MGVLCGCERAALLLHFMGSTKLDLYQHLLPPAESFKPEIQIEPGKVRRIYHPMAREICFNHIYCTKVSQLWVPT